MEKEFSQQIHKILKYSREEALRLKNDFISTEHLLLGFLKNNEKNMVYEVLKRLQCDPVDLRHKIEQTVKPLPFIVILDDVPLTKRAENVLKRAWVEANRTNALSISSEHLFLALLQEQDGLAAKILNVFDVTYDKARKELESLSVNNTVVKKNTNISAAIKQFGRDLTTLARKKSLDPVIGRDKEIERIIRILSRKKKNNPLIIGEPGVGKTAVVEGLAERIVEKRVPLNLINAQIFSLDLTSLVAGTSLRGKFEERLKLLLKNLLNLNNAILFIDEVHNIVGAGSNDNSMDISNMIKPLLAEGKLSVIGATTLNDYRKYIEKDKALARRFQNVLIESPNFNDTLKILKGVKAKYEEFHQVVYSTKTLKAAIKLSEQYITDRFLPDKAIDLLDEAGALTHLLNLENKKIHNDTIEKEANVKISREKILPIPEEVSDYQDLNNILSLQKRFKPEVTEHQIARILQSITGIPTSRLNRSEAEKLINLEDRLKKVIVGQDEAIGVITNSLKRARVGLKDPNKPIGSFIFVGPSGVGKQN